METITKEIKSEPDRKIENVFKVEDPLTELRDGFGYMGTLLRDTINDQLQCHICGKWKKGLNSHVIKTHKMSLDFYKTKFGLPFGLPLVSKSTSEKMSIRMSSPEALAYLEKVRDTTKAIRVMNNKKNRKRMRSYYKLPSYENMHGLCKEQIMRRYLMVCDIVGKQASQKDLVTHDESLFGVIINRFKTFNRWKKHNKMDIIKRPKIVDDDFILAQLKKFYIKTGFIPREKDFRKPDNGYRLNSITIRNHFGSFHRARILAGFTCSKFQNEK